MCVEWSRAIGLRQELAMLERERECTRASCQLYGVRSLFCDFVRPSSAASRAISSELSALALCTQRHESHKCERGDGDGGGVRRQAGGIKTLYATLAHTHTLRILCASLCWARLAGTLYIALVACSAGSTKITQADSHTHTTIVQQSNAQQSIYFAQYVFMDAVCLYVSSGSIKPSTLGLFTNTHKQT